MTKSVVSLQDQLVDVWGTIPYDAVLAIIKKTGKEVSLYVIDMISMANSSMLGSRWERGKFFTSHRHVNTNT